MLVLKIIDKSLPERCDTCSPSDDRPGAVLGMWLLQQTPMVQSIALILAADPE